MRSVALLKAVSLLLTGAAGAGAAARGHGLGAVGLSPVLVTMGIFSILLPDYVLIGLVLAVAFLGRGAAEIGVPEVLTYVHVPLLFAVLAANFWSAKRNLHVDLFHIALASLLLAICISAAVNDTNVVLAMVLSITLIEPIIVLMVLLHLSVRSWTYTKVLATILVLVQIPLALTQYILVGPSDHIQGTFGKYGAHPLGGIALVWIVAFALNYNKRFVPMIVLLLCIPFLADAKQMLMLFVLCIAPVLLSSYLTHSHRLRNTSMMIMIFVGSIILVNMFPAFRQILNSDIIGEYASTKLVATEQILDQVGVHWFGLGPGNGLSRTSLATVEGYGNIPQGLRQGHISEIANEQLLYYRGGQVSSAASPFSSWLGILTDIGIVGLCAYLFFLFATLKKLALAGSHNRLLASGCFLFWLSTGLSFTWLEEPSYSIAVLAGVSVIARSSYSIQLARHTPPFSPAAMPEANGLERAEVAGRS